MNFRASWYPPCLVEMPDMQRLHDKLAGRPFMILAVNIRESTGTIWKFHRKVKVDFTLLRDSDGQAARKWDAPYIVRIIEEMINEENNPQGM